MQSETKEFVVGRIELDPQDYSNFNFLKPGPPLPTYSGQPGRFVKLKRFEAATGYTVKAAQCKITEGVWVEGREYRRAPDGHILMDMEGFEKWVEKGSEK